MKTILTLAFAAAVVLTTAAHADDASKLKLAEAIVRVQIEQARPQLEAANKNIQAKIEAEPDAEKKAMLKKIFKDKLFDDEDITFMGDHVAQSMAEKFSETELQQIYTFISSPVGRKYDEAQSEMKKEMPGLIMQVIGRKMSAAGASMK